EVEREISHLATPLNVPMPISRRVLSDRMADYYGTGKSILVSVNGETKSADQIVVCNLADAGGDTWAHVPPDGKYAIDPELGRLALPPKEKVPATVHVTFHYAFSAPMGGGEYDRAASVASGLAPVATVPAPHAAVQDALDALPAAGGAAEIAGSRRYEETIAISVGAPAARIELRAADRSRPILWLLDDLKVTSPVPAGALPEGELTIDGFVIAG